MYRNEKDSDSLCRSFFGIIKSLFHDKIESQEQDENYQENIC